MHDESRVHRLNALLEAVLDRPIEERARFLDAESGNDPALRDEINQLLVAATPVDDFLERPVLPRPDSSARSETALDKPLFEIGDILAGRFRIVRLIGAGGMGEVYEALDLELGTSVALKTIRAHSAADAKAVSRFRREVLRARRVAHRHVCRVYDLFSHQPNIGEPVRFLTMELLLGVTLAEHLTIKGPLSSEETMRLGAQIASALDEAHRLQIVHRDLKPGNIMLVADAGETRAVVTDFGLALQLADSNETDPAVTSEARGGTDEYMAPEQRTSGVISAAVDVHAFGVVLHEMLTGVTPQRYNPAAHIDIPAPWRLAIEACLCTSPRLRPEPASAVMRIAAGERSVRSRRLAYVGLALAILAGVSLALLFSRFFKVSEPLASPTLVLSPIVNETGEETLDALSDVLRYQLTQSMFLNLLEPDQVSEVLRQMVAPPTAPMTTEVAREVAWRRGANVILTGRLANASRGYTLNLRAERRDGPPNVEGRAWSRTFEARDRVELQRIVREAGLWVRGTAGEAATEIPKADSPVDQVTSNSWEAVSLFSRAETLAAQARRDDALALLSEAVRIDPDFALARMRMGDILMGRRQLDQAAKHWDEALRVFGQRELTPREAYRIRGLYAHDAGDYAEAERVYRLWHLLYPNDPKPLFYIARPLLMLGRVEESIAMLEEAQRKDAYSYYIPAHLAMAYLRAGQLDASTLAIARLRVLGQPAWADCLQGQLDFLRGDYATALTRFESLERSDSSSMRSRASALQAAVLAEVGAREEAIARLERGRSADQRAGSLAGQADKLLALAGLHLRMGRRQVCRNLCLQAEQIDQSADRLTQAGVMLARAGYPADAERLLGRIDSASTVRSVQRNRHRLRGEILLARKDPQAAWPELQQAAALDASGMPLEYLARGALAAGETGLALATYRRMAADAGYYWHYPDLEPPGAWSDALATYLRLTPRIDRDADTSSLQRQLQALTRSTTTIANRR